VKNLIQWPLLLNNYHLTCTKANSRKTNQGQSFNLWFCAHTYDKGCQTKTKPMHESMIKGRTLHPSCSIEPRPNSFFFHWITQLTIPYSSRNLPHQKQNDNTKNNKVEPINFHTTMASNNDQRVHKFMRNYSTKKNLQGYWEQHHNTYIMQVSTWRQRNN